MKLELKIKDRIAKVELLHKMGNEIKISVDGKIYDIDLARPNQGIYSILHNGKSFNIEMVQGSSSKHYYVNTVYNSYQVEIIDAESRYLKSRSSGSLHQADNSISTPMPGKVVKIFVKPGDEVEANQTVIIVSAMKMESEFKTSKAGKVKAVYVKEGDLVEGNKVLVEIE